jgi:hypothetical protein
MTFDQNTIIQRFKYYHSTSMRNFVYSYINSKSQTHICDNSSFDNFDFDNEKRHYTPTNSMIYNFLNASKIMDCDNTIYLWPHIKSYIL